jgi:small GTP-binding protein
MGTAVSNLHITFVGRANVGKSRLVNCIFNESQFNSGEFQHRETEGKTEFVRILPNGELTIVETVIVDDKAKFDLTKQVISNSDFFILVLDAREELFNIETKLISYFQKNHIPFLVAVNKIEYGTNPHLISELDALEVTYFEVSCKENAGIESFRKTLIHMLPDAK